MRFRLFVLGVLMFAVLPSFVAAQTESINISDVFSDCTYFEFGGFATATRDTFWFVDLSGTTYNVAAGIGAADYFPPASVPTGVNSSGTEVTRTLPVKKVLFYGAAAFGAQPWQNGGSAPTGGADGAAYFWPVAGAAGEFAAIFSWPDSVHTAAVAAGDSVKIFVGYGY